MSSLAPLTQTLRWSKPLCGKLQRTQSVYGSVSNLRRAQSSLSQQCAARTSSTLFGKNLRPLSACAVDKYTSSSRKFSTTSCKAQAQASTSKPAEATLPRGVDRVPLDLKVGQKLHGFTVTSIEPVDEFSLTAYILTHDVTGAQYLHADCDDTNNSFNVCFRTVPDDSTGVAHILEHTVLCGSEKYPVRDPFFNMLKRSLNTFMNAMTAPDYTMYPFSTRNAADYYNLLSVYLDAAFFPKLSLVDFRQEGHRLEFEEPEDPNSKLMFKGVVFNEMKGAMSSIGSRFSGALSKELYPSTTYHHNSGGDPVDIPSLTHEDLKAFHSTHYHPSNALFYSYGDLPLAETLEKVNSWALSKFDKLDVSHLEVPDELRFDEPRKFQVLGPTDAMVNDPEKRSTVAVAWLLNNIATDPVEVFALQIAGDLLINGPNAPLYKALIEPNIGSGYAPGTGYAPYRREAAFGVGLKGVKDDDVEMIEKTILETMDKVAVEGFEKELVEANIHQVELMVREVSPSFGLDLGFSVMPVWMHGGSPLDQLRVGETIAELRKKCEEEPTFWQDLIKRSFLENKHRITVHMQPDDEFNTKLEVSEAELLAEMQSKLSEETKKQLVTEALELAEDQNKIPDVDSLPTLSVADIPSELERTISTQSEVEGVPIQWNDQATNGITYFNALYDLSSLPVHLHPYLPLFCSLWTQLGVNEMDYREASQAIKSSTGGFSADIIDTTDMNDLDSFTQAFMINGQCLDRNLEKMFELLSALTTPAGPAPFNPSATPVGIRWHSEPDRLATLLNRRSAGLNASVAQSGLSYAAMHAASGLSPEALAANEQDGLPHVNFVQRLVSPEAEIELMPAGAVPVALTEIANHLFGGGAQQLLRCRVAAQGSSFETVEKHLGSWLKESKAHEGKSPLITPDTKPFIPELKKTFFSVPSQCNYVAQTFRTVPYTHADSPALMILGSALSTCYLHREIREKGGAYGGGCSANTWGGRFTFNSYRDPNSVETLDVYRNAAEWAASEGSFSERDLSESLLRVFSSIDSPVAPSDRGLALFMSGRTDEVRQQYREKVLGVQLSDVKDVAEKYLVEGKDNASVAIVGNEEKVPVTHGEDGWEVLGANLKPREE
eukprot:CAMPEP_0197849842 /NCGR_PEP_ID=MMETSP1438-20131217/13379_1 /TAXON_ID=1461541 /ORGANISM="Pterosperma sp., Strain CCMP1384" /LENGTH=1115 /DNA_ID=CAMNT_0043462703 /DNA_START=99 /DNA_END=3446 /DNA_ORIENTATION=+